MDRIRTVSPKTQYSKGLIAVLSCNFLWGLLPIYWKMLRPMDSLVITYYRIVLMAIACFIACIYKFGIKGVFKPLFESKKKIFTYAAAGLVITINWTLYIWAVNINLVIQCCMGYYLEPLVICIFGVFLYKEKANKWKTIAIFFAVLGLVIMIIGYRELPVIAIGLGVSFATYSAIKKSVFISPIQSMLYETLCVTPFALILIVISEASNVGIFGMEYGWKIGILSLAGIMTAVPMGLFSFAANKLPLITLGLTEYIAPSMMLLVGIFLFKEPFDIIEFSAFVVIWIGLAFFTYGEIKDLKEDKQQEDLQKDE